MDIRKKLLGDFAEAVEKSEIKKRQLENNRINFKKALENNNLTLSLQFAKQESSLYRIDFLKEIIDKSIEAGRFDIADKAADQMNAYIPPEMLLKYFEIHIKNNDYDKILELLRILSDSDRIVFIQNEIKKTTISEEDKNYLASIYEALISEKQQGQQQNQQNKKRRK